MINRLNIEIIFFLTFIFLNQIQSNNNYAILIFTLQRTASYSSNSTTSNALPSINKTLQLVCTLQDLSLCAQMVPQTPSNAAFGRANATRPNSFLKIIINMNKDDLECPKCELYCAQLVNGSF